jgi:hypothetical protein
METISVPLSVPRFRSITAFSTSIKVLFILEAVFSLILLVTTPTISRLNSAAAMSWFEAMAALSIGAVVFLYFAVFVAGAVVFLIWIHHAYANLESLEVRYLRFTPGWAVGWFFIPIMSLFRPYQVVAETWRMSTEQNSAALVGWWWFLFLLHNWAGWLSYRVSNEAVTMTSYAVEVVGLIVTVVMVSRITSGQHRLHESKPPGPQVRTTSGTL